uniref:Transposase-associated domain-containing protein n=1 Tax=Oryza brachyantha TaxID=4533 RepID=J3MS54_ORYBR
MADTLVELILLNTRISSCIRPEIGKLRKLKVLDLSHSLVQHMAWFKLISEFNTGILYNKIRANSHNDLAGELPDSIADIESRGPRGAQRRLQHARRCGILLRPDSGPSLMFDTTDRPTWKAVTVHCSQLGWEEGGEFLQKLKMDRKWLYYVHRSSTEYREGITEFVKFTDNDRKSRMSLYISCPCNDCRNEKMIPDSSEVYSHLIRRGFMENYTCWSKHGEQEAPDVDADEEVSDQNTVNVAAAPESMFVPSPFGGDTIDVYCHAQKFLT